MRSIVPWLNESAYIAPLSPACKMCAKGAKMVVLVTGVCSSSCFYCPLSFRKGGKDVIFADEWQLKGEKDIETLIREAKYIKAVGAGITGGDPLLVWKRVKSYIKLLKETFGDKFHIHLYTSGLKNAEHIPDIVSAGLDEIRFHPEPDYWDKMEKSPLKQTIKNAIQTKADVAIEIPTIPNYEQQIISLIKWADNAGIRWINLNELEFSERNCNELDNRGYGIKDDVSAAVKNSQETAKSVLNSISKENLDIGVHFCSVSFKDGIQLRNRINRRAKSVAKKYEVISEEGTLIKGAVTHTKASLKDIFSFLQHEYEIPKKYLFIDKEKNRIELALWILETIANDLKEKGYECYMVEEYPTADRLEVERIPLPL